MNATDRNEKKQDQFDLKQEIFKYLPFWYLFVIGVIPTIEPPTWNLNGKSVIELTSLHIIFLVSPLT